MEDTEYNKLFDLLERLNNDEGYSLTLGIRDTNWVTPKSALMPWYECELVILDKSETIFSNVYKSQDAGETEFSLDILLTEAIDALNIYTE